MPARAAVTVDVDTRGGRSSLRRLDKSAKQTQSKLGGLQKAALGLFGAFSAIQSTRFIIGKTAELESQTRSLKVLTGSLEKAKTVIKEIQDFAAVTPFTSSELIMASKRLKAFGVDTENLVATTKRLADVSGATGAELTGIVTAYGQIQAKGKLQTEELLQLQERGIDIATELKNMYGMTGDEFSTALRKGQISAAAVEKAFEKLTRTSGQYFQGAVSQADTLNGKWSTLQDGIERVARVIGESLTPALKGALDVAIELVDSMEKVITGSFAGEMIKDRFALLTPGGTISDVNRMTSRIGSISGEGLSASSIDQLQRQISATQNLVREVTARTNTARPFAITKDERAAVELLQKTAMAKIEELEAARKILVESGASTKDLKEIPSLLNSIAGAASQVDSVFKNITLAVRDGLVDALMVAIEGTKTLGEVASGVFRSIARMLLQYGISAGIAGIAGPKHSITKFLGFADGGRPPVGKPSVVGERGPELFVPDSSGTIVPNAQLGGNTSIVVNIDASGSNVQGDEPNAQQLGRLIGSVVQSELIRQKRPGGLLAA